MTKRTAIGSFGTLATIILCAAFSQAADLTFFVGGVNPGSVDYEDIKTSLDTSPIFGFRLGTSIVPFFGLEHTLAFSSDYLFPRNVSAIKEAKGFVYNSNLIFNIPAGKVVPYLTAGAGLVHQYGDNDMPVGTRFAFNYGGGLKFPRLAGPLGLRFDMRGYRVGSISNKLNILEVSGGVLLSFGN
ncbi:MAG: outer membrane beta-barrel protein [Acidobacteria bacterium]|nr:outer membrane beta-barrel protein [Acidobacteriota bacterium]